MARWGWPLLHGESVRMVLRQGLIPSLFGVAVGLGLAFAGMRVE